MLKAQVDKAFPLLLLHILNNLFSLHPYKVEKQSFSFSSSFFFKDFPPNSIVLQCKISIQTIVVAGSILKIFQKKESDFTAVLMLRQSFCCFLVGNIIYIFIILIFI